MALQDMSAADLAAVMNNDNDGFAGGNGWWIILLFLFLGWGNNGWNNQDNANGMGIYPWMNSAETVMNGFANVQNSLCAGFANAETSATARQMADMQQMFALQTAMMQGFTQQQAQFAQCCCDNRLATQQLQTTIATEACNNRQALANSTQAILDKLCNQDLEAARRENEQLRQQLAMANLAASQVAQTAQIIDALKPAAAAA